MRSNGRVGVLLVVSLSLLAACGGGSQNTNLLAPSSLAYSQPSPTFVRGVAITADTPTSSGGAVASYAISPSVPAGLSFSTSSGVLSGTPTAVIPTTSFTVTASNATGSTTATLHITVIDAPTLSYAGASGTTGTIDLAMSVSPTTLSANGSPLTGCAVKSGTPALPAGLSVNASSCVISGTPSAASPATQYTIVATNAAGTSANATVTLTVDALVPGLSYAGASGTIGTVGSAMSVSPTTLVNHGAAITNCGLTASSPGLPLGLSIDATTCVISGTPGSPLPATDFTVTAVNAAGISPPATVTLTVNAGVPNLSYSGATGTSGIVGTAMSVAPTALASNGAAISACTVTPALPGGLAISSTTCAISGTPTEPLAQTTFTVHAVNSVGTSAAATVSLLVRGVPHLTYAGATGTTARVGSAFSIVPSSLLDGNSPITGCAVQSGPSLPSGLSIDPATCVITGTVQSAFGPTTFTLAATNAIGSSAPATVSLTALAGPPTLSYAGASGTHGTFGTAMSIAPTTLSSNGATLTGCALSAGSPPLPAGLTVNGATCVISGTPGAAIAATTFTVVATNSVGSSADALVSITVDPLTPALSYAGASGTTMSAGTAALVTPTTLAVNGAALTGCAIKSGTPALPAGLSVNPANCQISGTPTSTLTATQFTVVAQNSAGSSADALVTLTINAGVPTLSYAGAPNTSGAVGVAMSVAPTTLLTNGSSLTGCAITSASPPAWLGISSSTCVLSGTPTATLAATVITVVATNGAGSSSTASVTISAATAPSVPTLAYSPSPVVAKVGVAQSIAPTNLQSNGSALTNCALSGSSPAIPAGLSVDPSTCAIIGTPSAVTASQAYSVVASNAQGNSSPASITLAVADVPALSYAGSTGTTGKVGAAMSVVPTSIVSNGSSLTGCAIKPGTTALPPGLSVTANNCVISGTPSSIFAATQLTVVATNALGTSADATVTLTVNANKPSLSYAGASGTTGTFGTFMSVVPTTLKSNGAAITNCVAQTALPTGLSVDPGTCAISGTPSQAVSATSFIIAATNSAGTNTAQVTLTVNAKAPVVSYASASGTSGQFGTPMSVSPTLLLSNGAAITGCQLDVSSPALPAGLTIAPTTCVISGTPTEAASATYLVVASNSAGNSAQASLTLDIHALAPTLSYAGASGTQGKVGTAMSVAPTSFATNGAALTGCTASPSLPGGLTLDGASCAIGGTPTTVSAPASYTITATNSGGSTVAQVTLSVIDVPSLDYSGASGTTGLVGVAMSVSPTTFAANGSAVTGCTVSPALPTGLSIASTTCVISGTPTGGSPPTAYTVHVTNGAGSQNASVTLRVNTPAVLAISDGPTYDFGSWSTSATTSHLFVVTNSGSQTATALGPSGALASGFSYRGGSYPGLGGDCPDTLEGGASCTVDLQFAPNGAHAFSGTLSLAYNDGAQARTVGRALAGTGVSGAALAITDYPPAYYTDYGLAADGPSYDFGAVGTGTTVKHAFFVTNNGGSSATITGGSGLSTPFAFAGGSFPGSGGTCPGTLLAGQSCTVVVQFNPGSGPFSGSFSVNYTGGASGAASRSLAGRGTSAAAVVIHDFEGGPGSGGLDIGPAWNFGTLGIGRIAERDFVVQNSGGATATGLGAGTLGAGFSYPGGFPGAIPGTFSPDLGSGISYCGGSLPAGAQCAVRVRFSPTQAVGYSGNVAVSYGGGTTATRAMVGVGTSAALLSIAEDHNRQGLVFDYGKHALGSTTSAVFVVTNLGGAQADALTPASLPAGFDWTGGTFPGGSGSFQANDGNSYPFCTLGQSIETGEGCALSVDFIAPSNGTFAGALALGYSDGAGGNPSASRALQGEATDLAILDVLCDQCRSDGTLITMDLGTLPESQSFDTLILVTNTGAQASNVSLGSLSGAGFAFTGGSYPGGSGSGQFWGNSYPFCGPAPYSLAPQSACLVGVTFTAPASATTSSALLTLDGTSATPSTLSINFTARSTNLAIVSISTCPGCGNGGDVPTYDFGSVASGGTYNAFFFLTNNGIGAATLTDQGVNGAGFSYAGGTYPGGTPGSNASVFGGSYPYCPASGGQLAPGATCVIQVQYASSGSSPQTGGLSLGLGGATSSSLAYNLRGEPTTLAIVSLLQCPGCFFGGSGTPTYDFGTVATNASYSAYFIVTNRGLGDATVTDQGVSGAAFSYVGGAYPGGTPGAPVSPWGESDTFCPASGGTLHPGDHCVIAVTYAASGSAQQNGRLSLGLGGATQPSVAYNLQAEPTSLAIVSLTECPWCGGGGGGFTPTFDFGSVATNVTYSHYFFLTNTGLADATFTDKGVSGAGFSYTGGTFPGGTPGAAVSVYGMSFQFCPASGGTLAAGQSCVIEVSYAATGSTPQSGGFSFQFTGASTGGAAYNLRGEPTSQAIVTVSQCDGCGNPPGNPSYDFGQVASGKTFTTFLFVSNTGISNATVTAQGTSAGAFSYSGGSFPGGSPGSIVNVYGQNYAYCPASGGTLASGTTCVISIDYAASGSTPQSGSLSLALTGATQPSLTLDLKGEPTTLAIVTISGCPGCGGFGTETMDFGNVAAGSHFSTYVFVNNTGASSATLDTEALTGSGFGFTGGTYPGGTPGATVNVYGQLTKFCPLPASQLLPGSSCVIQIDYDASGSAQQTATLSLGLTGAVTSSAAINFQGEPTTLAIVSLAPCPGCGGGTGATNWDFGQVASGSTVSNFFFLSNTGANPATVVDDGFTGTAFGYTGGGYPGGTPGAAVQVWGQNYNFCPASGSPLNPGDTCVIQVDYDATGSAPQSGGFSLSLTGATSPSASVNLQGEPTTLAIVGLGDCPGCSANGGPPLTHDFGNVGAGTYQQYLFLQNQGANPATVSDSGFFGNPAFHYTGGTFPGGTAGSTVNVWGTNYNFCAVSGGTIAGHSVCVISVDYDASGNTQQSGGFTLALTGATTASVGFNLQGEPSTLGIVNILDCPWCSPSSSPFDFGTAGVLLDKVFVVTNSGFGTVTLGDGGGLAGPFSWTSGSYPGGTGSVNVQGFMLNYCGSSLAGNGAQCAISVRYSPLSSGSGTVQLSVTGAVAPSASRSLTGASTSRALATIAMDPSWFPCTDTTCGGQPEDFGTISAGTSIVGLMIVSNRGARDATLGVGTPLDAPYGWGPAGTGTFPGGSGTVNYNGVLYDFCGTTLVSGDQCLLELAFMPPTAGTFNTAVNLTVSDNLGALPNANRNLTGTAQ